MARVGPLHGGRSRFRAGPPPDAIGQQPMLWHQTLSTLQIGDDRRSTEGAAAGDATKGRAPWPRSG
ncbi:MAG: hypothetical protein ACXVHI_08775, partial [Frankiaceae bacterium]